MNEEHLFSATFHPYRVCESDPPAGHTAGHLAYIPNTGGRPDRQRWRTLRGACPLSRPALPGHGETMALNIRLRMNCSYLTFPALQRSSLSERERQRERGLSVRHGGELFACYLDQIKFLRIQDGAARGERRSRGPEGFCCQTASKIMQRELKGDGSDHGNTSVMILCCMFYVEIRVTTLWWVLPVWGRKTYRLYRLYWYIWFIANKLLVLSTERMLLLVSLKHIKETQRERISLLWLLVLIYVSFKYESTLPYVILNCLKRNKNRHNWDTCWHAVESYNGQQRFWYETSYIVYVWDTNTYAIIK